MLLSHNFDIKSGVVTPLTRGEFVEVFQAGLKDYPDCNCRLISHPHWSVEIKFPQGKFTPQQIGEVCAKAMHQKRQDRQTGDRDLPEILILGGIKLSPATSELPETLQPGEWGVDVVETQSRDTFLEAIAWETVTAQKAPGSIFKVELKTNP
ncbi:hypothetical protein Lepto7376_0039 [[Leptolyngbya] sp. PCC 7376]|nr:hypothetical protein Lepto7376_0039 [[Leptolyngbya] sp. PCC 7376]